MHLPSFLAGALLLGASLAHADPVAIPVTLNSSLGPHQSGRLLVFAHLLDANAKPDEDPNDVGLDIFSDDISVVAAREVTALAPGRIAWVDGETDTYPVPFSTLPPGTYELQAVLDRNHDFNYDGRSAGDLVSKVVHAKLPGPLPTLLLEHVILDTKDADELASLPPERRAIIEAWAPKLKSIEFQSRLMTSFRGMPTYIRGWVALPPGYDGKRRFATSYLFPGFGNTLASSKPSAAVMMSMMADGKAPPMIWVYLDYAIATGTHEFADSANNGPWGAALTTELIPALEREYRMDARTNGRFVTGHSSGGWAALWLQVRYPGLFGGSWPVSPDPSDFHDLFGADLYAPNANFFHDANGKRFPASRPLDGGFVVALEAFARSEAVLGPIGGQFATYDFVYSPRGENGMPLQLYDRTTGKIDPAVAAYWIEHYDIAHIVTRDWKTLKPRLDGKIHLSVGALDTWYLDHPAMKLEAAMKSVGAKTDFRYIAGKGHNDVFERDGDRNALLEDIAWEMYRKARPAAPLQRTLRR
jgi:Putative esterase